MSIYDFYAFICFINNNIHIGNVKSVFDIIFYGGKAK